MFHRQERTKLNMIKCNKKIGIIIGIVIIALLMFIHPLLFKKNYIEKIAKIDLPKSANLIDSKFYVDLYGVQLTYAKVEIDDNTYNSMNVSVASSLFDSLQNYVDKSNYNSLNLNNADELKCSEIMDSKYSLVAGATTRVTYCIAVKENNEKYYIYILSY